MQEEEEEEAPVPQQPAAPAVPLTYAERLMANTNKQTAPAPSARPQPAAAAPAAPAQAAPEAKAAAPAPYNGIPNGNHHTENGCALPNSCSSLMAGDIHPVAGLCPSPRYSCLLQKDPDVC